jgi:hypothetical protein
MKNSKKNKLGKGILKGVWHFVKGMTTGNPVISMVVGGIDGVVKGAKDVKIKNVDSETGGVGEIDYVGAVGATSGFIIIICGGIAVSQGWITMEDLKEVFKMWLKTQ